MLSIVLNERVRSVSSSMPPGSMASSWSVSVTRMTASVSRWIGSRPERAITQPIAPATSTAEQAEGQQREREDPQDLVGRPAADGPSTSA